VRARSRTRQPAWRLACPCEPVRERDFLAEHTVHFVGERLIRDDEVNAAFVADGRRGDRFFIQRGNDCAVHVFRPAGLRVGNPKLQCLERTGHTVRLHFIRISDARSQMRVLPHEREERAVDRRHGADLLPQCCVSPL
jgi:hypothetical protein